MNTIQQYEAIRAKCTDIFVKKMRDYGTSWRILRPQSITDQIYIKAKRIKTLEEKKVSKVGEGIVPEFIAIANYAIMGLIQMELGSDQEKNQNEALIEKKYNEYFEKARELMEAKNHDYGEAWRDMRTPSLTDMILMKVFRTKQIEENEGKTIISEGIDANYFDMINYAVFALIQLGEDAD